MNTTITLQIEGSAAREEKVAGWAAEVYRLDGPSRGTETAPHEIKLPFDAVLELDLANGTSILVAAEDAERYLGAAEGKPELSPSARLCASKEPACPMACRGREKMVFTPPP